MNREEKKADNIVNELKKKINRIDNEIDEHKKHEGLLKNIKEEFIEINKDLDDLFGMISNSIKSKKDNAIIEEMARENIKRLANITEQIDNDTKGIQKRITELNNEKEDIEKSKREE